MVKGSVLVGADGVSSKGTSDPRVYYEVSTDAYVTALPCGFVGGEVTLPRGEYEKFLQLANSFHFGFAAEHEFRLLNAIKGMESDGSAAYCYWMFMFPDEAVTSSSPYWALTKTNDELLAWVKERVVPLRAEFRQLVDAQNPEDLIRPFVLRDCLPQKAPDGPVTLLGDAVHAMSFCESRSLSSSNSTTFNVGTAIVQGEGADHAMRDAITLGRELHDATLCVPATDGIQFLSAALRTYEEEMAERGTEAVMRSRRAVEMKEHLSLAHTRQLNHE